MRRTEDRIEGLRTKTKFRHVRLAQDDRSRLLLPLHDAAIEIRHVVFVQRGAIGRADAVGLVQVFHGNR